MPAIIWTALNFIAQAVLKYYLGRISAPEAQKHEEIVKNIYREVEANRPLTGHDAIERLRQSGDIK